MLCVHILKKINTRSKQTNKYHNIITIICICTLPYEINTRSFMVLQNNLYSPLFFTRAFCFMQSIFVIIKKLACKHFVHNVIMIFA